MIQFKLPIEDFTTPDPITASEEATLQDLRKLMDTFKIRHIPIIKESQVIGVVSDNSLHLVSGLSNFEKSQVLARDIMTPDPVFVDASTTLDDVAFEMSSKKLDSVIVNEGDQMLGIFTLTDALNALIEVSREAKYP